MTRYEYMKNELEHAEWMANTLTDVLDKKLFAVHAERLRLRIGEMTPAEGSVVVFDDE